MNTQLQDLFIAYGVTATGMLAGLLLMRAGAHAYWRWPVYSAMVMVLGAVTWSLLRRYLLPPIWELRYTGAWYYGALTLYGLLGAAMGMLLGRLTRRKTSVDDTNQESPMSPPGPRPPPKHS